jgi:hypothetical protein
LDFSGNHLKLFANVPTGYIFQPLDSVSAMEKNENEIKNMLISIDNGGRRSGGDRRNYSYTIHIPERRGGQDRRCGEDRRKTPRFKGGLQG